MTGWYQLMKGKQESHAVYCNLWVNATSCQELLNREKTFNVELPSGWYSLFTQTNASDTGAGNGIEIVDVPGVPGVPFTSASHDFADMASRLSGGQVFTWIRSPQGSQRMELQSLLNDGDTSTAWKPRLDPKQVSRPEYLTRVSAWFDFFAVPCMRVLKQCSKQS